MTDIERLREWMRQRDLTTKQMAREMEMPYATVYHAVIERGEKAGKDTITGNFVVRFAATYGMELAAEIFATLAPREMAAP
jgi:hypothetical protein